MFNLFLRSLLILSLPLFFAACANDDDDGASPAAPGPSPELNIKTIDGACLDLQSLVAQIESPDFKYPAFAYTRDFQILSQPPSRNYAESLYARSLRAERMELNELPDLRGVEQQGCDTVTLPDAGQVMVPYKIIDYSTRHLELELDRAALETAYADLPEAHRKIYADLPAVHGFIIRVPAPTQLELVTRYQAVPLECARKTRQQFREEIIYTWAPPGASPDLTARLDVDYWTRLHEIANAQTPVQPTPTEPTEPVEPGPEPEPVPETGEPGVEPEPVPEPEEPGTEPQPVPETEPVVTPEPPVPEEPAPTPAPTPIPGPTPPTLPVPEPPPVPSPLSASFHVTDGMVTAESFIDATPETIHQLQQALQVKAHGPCR